MSDKRLYIGDDEIRIIASDAEPRHRRKKRRTAVIAAAVAIGVVIAAAAVLLLTRRSGDTGIAPLEETMIKKAQANPETDNGKGTAAAEDLTEAPLPAVSRGYVSRRDTTVNGTTLIIITPLNATPRLMTGNGVFADSTLILAAQAADIRKDNGEIAGTYVLDGQLISKGEAKAGYCSIVNGEISIGVADATPMLEQALQTDGYFFRQYPLVAAGLVVENRPKGKARRKALAEINGDYSIVTSPDPLSFHDFSQALIDVGARNAIYLVGGAAETVYTDDDGNRHIIGNSGENHPDNVNYIVWR
ncbi:MAG: hypothetical protein K2L73_00525 [Muribaculaceae bacterium]|nr:hypothetical protein [Muribaculaceae bacterium]